MINAALIIIYIVTSAYGLYLLKGSPGPLSTSFAIGFVAYGIGFAIWLYILMRMPLSIAFPVAAGGLIVATQVAGIWFLGEKATTLHATGVVLVLAGIVMIYARA